MSIDDIEWGDAGTAPEVSAGDDLWVHRPDDDATTDVEFDSTEGGQFRLWPEETSED